MSDPHLIQTLEQLATHYPQPRSGSRSKVHSYLTEQMQLWLSHSPFFVLASMADGGVDCSPRGDLSGDAFRVVDRHTIAIPDRRGNNRIDTLRNILNDSRVGLVFLIPGIEQAIRIKGDARISVDPLLLQTMTLAELEPATVILVNVTAAYVQNARAVRSAKLWDPGSHVNAETLPDAQALSGKPAVEKTDATSTPDTP